MTRLTRYYIDDSGYADDFAISRDGLRFNGQPDFVLAAVGVRDLGRLERDIAAIKHRHALGRGQLKWVNAQAHAPFVYDLIDYLVVNQHPLLVECVDKRFFIATQIVNTLVLPTRAEFPEGQDERFARNVMAEFVGAHAPDSVFEAFLLACRLPSVSHVMAALDAMQSWLPRLASPALQIAECVRVVRDEFLASAPHCTAACLQFLPIADRNDRGQSAWLLPHYSSLTSLHARIKELHPGKLRWVRLVHEQHFQLEGILDSEQGAAPGIEAPAPGSSRQADYRFTPTAPVCFEHSASSVGLQLADVLTGLIRHTISSQRTGAAIHPQLWQAFRFFWEATHPGPELHVVIPTNLANRLSFECLRRHDPGARPGGRTKRAERDVTGPVHLLPRARPSTSNPAAGRMPDPVADAGAETPIGLQPA